MSGVNISEDEDNVSANRSTYITPISHLMTLTKTNMTVLFIYLFL